MNGTNDTNVTISGNGTTNDPYTYNFHATEESYGAPWMFWIVMIVMLGATLAAGFLIGFYFGKRRKNPN
jgi:ABC-type multidrug transport system permease subunit